jgi:hypothetical protein
MNNLKVCSLLAAMTALFGVVGQALGGQGGMLIALLAAGVMNFVMHFTSSKTVLHAYRARTLSPEEASGLYATVDKLRQLADANGRDCTTCSAQRVCHRPQAATRNPPSSVSRKGCCNWSTRTNSKVCSPTNWVTSKLMTCCRRHSRQPWPVRFRILHTLGSTRLPPEASVLPRSARCWLCWPR